MLSIPHWIRRAIEPVLAARGYELKVIDAPVRGFARALAHLRRKGFRPRTVFDVGVGNGTSWLYEGFPDADLVLFEPLQEFEPDLRAICDRWGGEYHLTALGRSNESRHIYRAQESLTGSSFLPRTELTRRLVADSVLSSEPYMVRPLDDFADRDGPFLVKIDTEGYEREVILGAARALARTEVIILEGAIVPRYVGEASLSELVAMLEERGFWLYDIPQMAQRPDTGALSYVDAIFVRVDSDLLPGAKARAVKEEGKLTAE